jgi:hypothetical protein
MIVMQSIGRIRIVPAHGIDYRRVIPVGIDG